MKEVKITLRGNQHETVLVQIDFDTMLCHVAMIYAEQKFIETKLLLTNRKLFVQPKALSSFGRYDFLPDVTSHSPLMRLPHILGSQFGLYVMPMPINCLNDFEWIVTDIRETWGVTSAKVD